MIAADLGILVHSLSNWGKFVKTKLAYRIPTSIKIHFICRTIVCRSYITFNSHKSGPAMMIEDALLLADMTYRSLYYLVHSWNIDLNSIFHGPLTELFKMSLSWTSIWHDLILGWPLSLPQSFVQFCATMDQREKSKKRRAKKTRTESVRIIRRTRATVRAAPSRASANIGRNICAREYFGKTA